MTKYQRALQIWMILVCGAVRRRSFTYGEVAALLGMKSGRVIPQFLGPVMWYCQANRLPPLTVIVVNRDTGLPGAGLSTLDDVNRDREKVYRFDWFSLSPPEAKDFSTHNKD